MSQKLYVGNLSYDVTEDELSQLFGRCGRVTGVRIIKDRDTGKSKGFAFVEMESVEEAEAAVQHLKGQDLRGRPVVVDIAREKGRSSGGGRGGYGNEGRRRHG